MENRKIAFYFRRKVSYYSKCENRSGQGNMEESQRKINAVLPIKGNIMIERKQGYGATGYTQAVSLQAALQRDDVEITWVRIPKAMWTKYASVFKI